MTVELDKEEGPHVQVTQGSEPAAFLNLWRGMMTIHLGKRGSTANRNSRLRMFVVRGELEDETCLLEVDCRGSSLRSSGSFVLVDKSANRILVWNGSASPEHKRKMAAAAAEKISKTTPVEMGLRASPSVESVDEGSESADDKGALGLPSEDYVFKNPSSPKKSPRLFHMSSTNTAGHSFEVREVLCPSRRTDVLNTMPFNQSDLYIDEQPGKYSARH